MREIGEKPLDSGASPSSAEASTGRLPPFGLVALVLAIATTVLCFAVPFGIPALVYAVLARRARSTGEMDVAEKYLRRSLVFSTLAFSFGVAVELFLLVRHLAAGFQ
jgi:hypothetical protein